LTCAFAGSTIFFCSFGNSIFSKEWCKLSIEDESWSFRGVTSSKSESVKKGRMQNFFTVASRASSNHRVYRRDLEMLLGLSMDVHHHDLALDLGKFQFWGLQAFIAFQL
jgi:hypothetical protein